VLRHRTAMAATTSALAVILLNGCSRNDRPPTADDDRPRSDIATDVIGGVPLAQPAAELARQCRDAAARLRFAVPCPTTLPLVAGDRPSCPASCVATAAAGETEEAHIYFLNLDSYDTEPGAPQAVRHLIIGARKEQDAPPTPCYDGTPAGDLDLNATQVALLDCPPSSPEAEANNRHGQGAHAEHVLGYWDTEGVRYTVSVHGTTDDSRALLEHLIASIELVEP
jgi:hypothetical protein